MGGRFNAKLTCGPGWIFKADRLPELEALISGAGVMPADTRTTEAPKKANDLPEWYVTPERLPILKVISFAGCQTVDWSNL